MIISGNFCVWLIKKECLNKVTKRLTVAVVGAEVERHCGKTEALRSDGHDAHHVLGVGVKLRQQVRRRCRRHLQVVRQLYTVTYRTAVRYCQLFQLQPNLNMASVVK